MWTDVDFRTIKALQTSKAVVMARYILFAAVLIAASLQTTYAFSANSYPSPAKTIEFCRSISDVIQRLHCFEDVTADRPAEPPASPKNPDGWRLVRTPGPKGADDIISMMRTADLARSDPDLAGLTLHCGQQGPEVLIIVVQPFPPRSKPRVTLGSPINEVSLEASVLPSGAALLLPDDAVTLAKGPWQSQVDLPIKIEDGDTKIRGVVLLSGLNTALQTLTASCPSH